MAVSDPVQELRTTDDNNKNVRGTVFSSNKAHIFELGIAYH